MKQVLKFFKCLMIASFFNLTVSPAQADNADQMALQMLEGFLFDAAQRAAYAKGNPKAQRANQFLEAMPDYAQKDMLDVVMMIMRESKNDAVKHVKAHKSGGARAAMASFSPAVKQKIKDLVKKLSKDKSFSKPQNLQKLQTMMPKDF